MSSAVERLGIGASRRVVRAAGGPVHWLATECKEFGKRVQTPRSRALEPAERASRSGGPEAPRRSRRDDEADPHRCRKLCAGGSTGRNQARVTKASSADREEREPLTTSCAPGPVAEPACFEAVETHTPEPGRSPRTLRTPCRTWAIRR